MKWKVWLISKIAMASALHSSRGHDKPKDLPQAIGRHLVVDKGFEPDWVWNLKYVRKSHRESKGVYDIRVFNPMDTAKKDIKIRDYESLNDHIDLVLISGRYDKNDEKVALDYSHMENLGFMPPDQS